MSSQSSFPYAKDTSEEFGLQQSWRNSYRKREALAALKQMLELDPEAAFDPDEPDLQPLAAMPEFKAMKEKMKETSAPAEEVKPAKP